jgi:hypothetical protein
MLQMNSLSRYIYTLSAVAVIFVFAINSAQSRDQSFQLASSSAEKTETSGKSETTSKPETTAKNESTGKPETPSKPETTGKSEHDQEFNVELVGTPPSDEQSRDVVAVMRKLFVGIAERNLDEIGACLSDEVTTFDARKHDVLYGKTAVLENMKKNLLGTDGNRPVKRLTVYAPFVSVKGDTAMVSFRAVKEIASGKLESWCSDVFERKDGKWLVLQHKTDWKPAKNIASDTK